LFESFRLYAGLFVQETNRMTTRKVVVGFLSVAAFAALGCALVSSGCTVTASNPRSSQPPQATPNAAPDGRSDAQARAYELEALRLRLAELERDKTPARGQDPASGWDARLNKEEQAKSDRQMTAAKLYDAAKQQFEGGLYAEAIENLDRALALDPANIDAISLRRKVNVLIGNSPEELRTAWRSPTASSRASV
jgi:hypothetical protein